VNYIQRLLDSAAPVGAATSFPVAPASAGHSPIIAADQRLGLFPTLVTPLAASASPLEAGAPWAESPEAARRANDVSLAREPARVDRAQLAAPSAPIAAPAATEQRGPEPSAASSAGSAPAASARGVEPTPPSAPIVAPAPRAMSALQRLVEADPLPSVRRRASTPEPRSSAPSRPAATESVASATRAAAPITEAAPTRPAPFAALSPLPPSRNPSEITPDQFQVRTARTASSAPPEAQAPALPARVRAPAESTQTAGQTRPFEPVRPAASAGSSPFARHPELAASAPAPRRSEAAKPTPERIIERIREVPAPAPPKAMTAAAQSVIGSLSARRAGAFRPRQGEL
jgi:nicotinate-nucleotide--dimethylbenzimidazole phosphoribosyltransferase